MTVDKYGEPHDAPQREDCAMCHKPLVRGYEIDMCLVCDSWMNALEEWMGIGE